jgi:DNA-binding NarL/FixJ family response regulator
MQTRESALKSGLPAVRSAPATSNGTRWSSADDGELAPAPEPAPAPNGRTRVLLVDDQRMVREGLRALLSRKEDLEIVGEAADGSSAVELVRDLSPDVVVMDIEMPGLNGVEATRRLKAHSDRVRVVALSAHTDEAYVRHMLAAGACGYVLKATSHEDLLEAVRTARSGGTYLSPAVARLALGRSSQGMADDAASAYFLLGSREREVVQLVAEGKTSAEMAQRMGISVRTVETHRRNVLKKLGLHGTAELTKYALRQGLTSLET